MSAHFRLRCEPRGVGRMPVLQEKWISDPLSVVKTLFEQSGGGRGSWGVQEYFSSRLQSEEALAKVPSLNDTPLDYLPNGCLVRYRGMVQDQFDPEFYLRVYQAVNTRTQSTVTCCGMYKDVTDHPTDYEIDFDSPSNITEDRQTLYCVPIPGETAWAKAAYSKHDPTTEQTPMGVDTEQGPRGGQVKRQLSEEGDEVEGEGMEVEGEGGTLASKRRRSRDQSDRTSSSCAAPETVTTLNFPLPNEGGPPCLVKVYGEGESLKVTAMVEFIGVLSVDPVLAHFEHRDEGEGGGEEFLGETAAERKAHCPPPSLTPRLHCIVARRLPHSNPLLPSNLTIPVPSSALLKMSRDFPITRQLVLDSLTQALLGDQLAAEYTLLHLLSSVHGRTEMLALGKFSLNLTGCPLLPSPSLPPPHTPSLATTLYSVIEKLVPKCFLLPLSISTLNSWTLSPKKDYSANRLLAGVLQLSEGTHLVVDETALEPGQLNERGVRNLTALGHVVQGQRVHYDFHYHTAKFDCNLPVMIFSEGKSILNVDCRLPLSPSTPHDPPGAEAQLSEDQLHQVRGYLGLHRMAEYKLTPEVQKTLEEDFVQMRKTDPEMSAETFHHLLTVARLVSLSFGRSELSLEHWQYTKQLEHQRRDRLKQ